MESWKALESIGRPWNWRPGSWLADHQWQSRRHSPPIFCLTCPLSLITSPCQPPITPVLPLSKPPSPCNCTSISIFRPISRGIDDGLPAVWWFPGGDLHKLGRRGGSSTQIWRDTVPDFHNPSLTHSQAAQSRRSLTNQRQSSRVDGEWQRTNMASAPPTVTYYTHPTMASALLPTTNLHHLPISRPSSLSPALWEP